MDMRRRTVLNQVHPPTGYGRDWLRRYVVYAVCAVFICLAGLAYGRLMRESSIEHVRATNASPPASSR